MIEKNNLNSVNVSYVMGRFSKKIGNKFQHFPIDNWQKEIIIAKKFNFDGVEWIISDFSNPIFNKIYLNNIKNLLKKKNIKMCSISLDLIMENPLHSISKKNLEWLINKLNFIQKQIPIKRISVPIEEKARYRNQKQKKTSLNKLCLILKKLSNKSKICIETDISPKKLREIFKEKRMKKLGLLVDIGNVRANGFKINEYINFFCDKIFGIHVKYRSKIDGKSKLIPKKFMELEAIKKNLNRFSNLKDITFQTFRSDKNFMSDMKKNIKNFNEIFKR